MEETPWVTITFLLTVVVAAFGYRFFGPEQPQLEEQPIESTTGQRVDEKLEEAEEKEVTKEVATEVAQEPEVKDVEATEEEESLESSGSEFENINPADVPKVEEISQGPRVEVEVTPAVSSAAVEVEVEEEITEETEEDIVKTIDLTPVKSADVVDAALDEYLGREPSVDETESTEIIEAKEEKPQENAKEQADTVEDVVEELITPLVAQEEETEPELDALPTPEPLENEPERKSPAALDEIIAANLGDQTLMTPAKCGQAMAAEILEDVVEAPIEPIHLVADESEPAANRVEDIERKIENVAEQLIADTLDQIKSDDLLNQTDGKSENNDSGTVEDDIIPANQSDVNNDLDEKKVRAEQLTEIADLIAKTPGMAGEGLDVESQAKMYIE